MPLLPPPRSASNHFFYGGKCSRGSVLSDAEARDELGLDG
jgi:hypothetical protein